MHILGLEVHFSYPTLHKKCIFSSLFLSNDLFSQQNGGLHAPPSRVQAREAGRSVKSMEVHQLRQFPPSLVPSMSYYLYLLSSRQLLIVIVNYLGLPCVASFQPDEAERVLEASSARSLELDTSI